ncbi:MAG: PRTRC system protein E [Flavobacteriales bacterium]|nr:PRTRC system protein E [Flavobacteriales bacterium]
MTDFFKQIEALATGQDLIIAISKKGETMTVSVCPKADPATVKKDDTVESFTPLVISGTADELNEGFFEAVKEPLEKSAGLITSVAEFEEEVVKKTESSKPAKAKKKAAAPAKPADTDAKKKEEEKKAEAAKKLREKEEAAKAKAITGAMEAIEKAKKANDIRQWLKACVKAEPMLEESDPRKAEIATRIERLKEMVLDMYGAAALAKLIGTPSEAAPSADTEGPHADTGVIEQVTEQQEG